MTEPHRCTGVSHVRAECMDCGWLSFARNAVGNAARHAKASGHHVIYEQLITGAYNCTTDHEAARALPPDAA